ncbi:unnamed protein product [Phaedon cochleariae]|uniref:WD repeat-containing protein 75 second beta-propeller domain-containing protein n=1 Tax=Phaedon cochleariae TaxID=80249 RepID=A0A9P0DU20_PHACE|nr:unnamed protein product [Phaedon cochleariae]
MGIQKEMDVSVVYKGGGSFVKLPPIFSSDGKSIFVCSKNTVLEYNTKTGKLIYEYKGLSTNIVGFNYHIHDSHQCLTVCSESGKTISWKILTHTKVLEKQLPFKIVKTFNVIFSTSSNLKAVISYQSKEKIQFAITDIQEKTSKKIKLQIPCDKNNYFMNISNNEYFSVAHGNRLHFVNLTDPRIISRCSIHDSRTFTCVACHPSEQIVLTGDSTGRVLVWQNLFSKEKIQTVFHWHTLPVRTVCFSTSGSYFYSGGEECVLVKWQLENVNDKKFVPRLAAEINQIVVANNNLYVAVATQDNAIKIFDSTLNQLTLIQHLVLGQHYDSGIVYDPRTKALIMNGNKGQLQFYTPEDMSLLYSVDIVGQNKVTNERECVILNTEITKVAISQSGLWLASVEERKDIDFHNEIRLKFWNFDESKQTFTLNTSIEYPHDDSINCLLFQPTLRDEYLRCVTVGNDKKFKIWQVVDCSTVYKKSLAWKCHGVGFYRDLPCSTLSFAMDGSLMAIGFGQILTAWVPDSCELKCSLSHPIYRDKLKWVQFGHGNHCHLLVSASDYQLSVWNILTLSMTWTVPLAVFSLIFDPLLAYMAVITQDRKVFVFSPGSPEPIYESKNLLKQFNNILTASFIPSRYSNDSRLNWFERSHIYFITSEKELYCLSGNQTVPEFTMEVESDEYTVFSSITPNTKINLNSTTKPNRHLFEKDSGRKTIKKYLEGPIHTMAPIRFSCHSLLKSLVIQKDALNVT